MFEFAFIYSAIIIVVMTIVLIKEFTEPDIAIFSALILMVVGRVISVDEALVGFSNKGMLTVGFLFIVAEALRQTGILNKISSSLLGNNKKSISSKLLRLLFPVSAFSAFFNNTPIVAMLIPSIQSWAKKNDYAVSKFLIPLSYAAILGGTCTLIGTSTNLVIQGLMIENGIGGMSFFEISKIGVPVTIIGVLLIAVLGHRILPDRKEPLLESGDNTRKFVIELKVEANFQHIKNTIEEAGLRHLKGLFLFQIERKKTKIAPVSPDEKIFLRDRLFFTGLPETIIELQKTPGLTILKDTKFDLKNYDSDKLRTFEAVIAPNSPLIGTNVRESNFRSRYNAVIIAIHRQGERIEKKIGDIVLRAGDTLLMLATNDFLNRWYNSEDFYLVSESARVPSKPKWYSSFSLSILTLMIVAMAFNIVPIVIATSVAAIIFVLSKCISREQATKSVKWNVLIIIASAFGIARALENSGIALYLAGKLILAVGPFGILGLLAGIYYLTSFYTETITNNAAAALIFPIAVATATQAGLDPRPFAIAVALAASASFATPLGYQTNLMVYGPGGYKFKDFMKIGIPMNFIIGVVAIAMIYLFYFM